MKEIELNQAKSIAGGAKDFSFDKLEIPVTLPTVCFGESKSAQRSFMQMQVN